MNEMSCLSLVGMFLAIMAMLIIGILAIPVNGYDSKPRSEQKKVDDNYWDSMGLSPPEEENNNYWYVNSSYPLYFSNYKLHKKASKPTKVINNSTRKQDIISIIRTTNGLEYSIEVDGSLPEGAVKKRVVINY